MLKIPAHAQVSTVGRIVEQQQSSHPRLNHNGIAAGQLEHRALGDAGHFDHRLAHDSFDDPWPSGVHRDRLAGAATLFHGGNHTSFDAGANPPHHGLYFRQFRHII